MKRVSEQSRTFIRGFFCISIILVGLNMLPIRSTHSAISSLDLEIDLSLTPHTPISITSDSGLEAFPGSGIEEDPYVIEGYNITAPSSNGIFITGTTKYFTIRNCYIETISSGINIDTVADGTVTVFNNTCNQNSLVGINLYASKNSSIINNTCNYNDLYGIMLISSGDSTIANNTCENNDQYGIYLYASGNSTVENNACSNNGSGIYIKDSLGSKVINNTCSNNSYANIYLLDSGNSTVTNNTCSSCNYSGILLNSSSNSTVTHNMCSNINQYGIKLYASGSSSIANNTCKDNNLWGVSLSVSSNSTAANNTFYNNGIDGIELSYSDYCFIIFNLLQENGVYGIEMAYGSDNNTIHHNTFVDNNDDSYGGSQAGDSGISNTWYDTDTFEGNYWDDWSGTGSYSIDGTAGSFDPYPLDETVLPPIISEYFSNFSVLFLAFAFSFALVPLSLIVRKRSIHK